MQHIHLGLVGLVFQSDSDDTMLVTSISTVIWTHIQDSERLEKTLIQFNRL